MIFGVLFNFGTASSSLEAMGAWSLPLFNEFLPYALIIAGIGLCFWGLRWLVSAFTQHH